LTLWRFFSRHVDLKQSDVILNALERIGEGSLSHLVRFNGNPFEQGSRIDLVLVLLLLDPLDLGDDVRDLFAAAKSFI
jgi:hypothetical protein